MDSYKRSSSKIQMMLIATVSSLVIAGPIACSPSGSGRMPDPDSQELIILPEEPTTPLQAVDNSPDEDKTDPTYGVYKLMSAQFGANIQKKEISARVIVQSTMGTETVSMLGKIRDDGTASLIDIQPVKGNQYRLVAEAFCSDGDDCKNIILNVVYKIGDSVKRRQFISQELTPDTKVKPNPQATVKENSDQQTAASPAKEAGQSGQTAPVTLAAPALDPNSPDAEVELPDMPGEFVGAQPPKAVIDKIWMRPDLTKEKTAPPVKDVTATGDHKGSDETVPAPPADAVNATQEALPADSNHSAAPAVQAVPASPNTTSTDPQSPAPKETAKSSAAAVGSVNKQSTAAMPSVQTNSAVPAKSNADPAAATKSGASKKSESSRTPPRSSGIVTREPVVAQAEEIPQDREDDDVEKKLAPMLDLVGGGKAIGSYQSGHLQKAKALTSQDPVVVLHPESGKEYGTGMMLSLILNASKMMPKWFPSQKVLIGNIAHQTGGHLSGQQSHQNGLDIDIPYIGTPGFQSIVPQGHIIKGFQYGKTWQFLRVVHGQKIVMNGKPQTAMSMIFVGARVKAGFCAWAKQNDMLKNPVDADILRRMLPTAGHDNHFHLRLKCSPHYPACRNVQEPREGTGC